MRPRDQIVETESSSSKMEKKLRAAIYMAAVRRRRLGGREGDEKRSGNERGEGGVLRCKYAEAEAGEDAEQRRPCSQLLSPGIL